MVGAWRLDAGTSEPGAGRPLVLVVSQNVEVIEAVSNSLPTAEYAVTQVPGGQQAEELVRRRRPDLVILDLVLPDTDGLLELTRLKSIGPIPVILLGRTQRRSDVELGFRLGADDFLVAPFNPSEFRARVRAVLRRAGQAEVPAERVGPATMEQRFEELVVEPATGRATIAGQPLRLTPLELRLLTALVSAPGQMLTRRELVDRIWGTDDANRSRSIDVHMGRIRAKLQAVRGAPVLASVRIRAFRLLPAEARTPTDHLV
jgi:DNA-binding response OmpR family regulator